MKIRCTYKFIFTQIQIKSIGKVFHENSFEKRNKVTRNGLLFKRGVRVF